MKVKNEMTDVIKLGKSDFKLVKELNKKRKSGCTSLTIKKCFDKHLKDGLKYNKKTGVLSNKSEWLAKYSHKEDIPKNPTRDEVIEWHFMNEIANSCSRMKRGYEP